MASLKPESLLDLPDEVLEKIMAWLTFSDLFNIRKLNKRLEDCQKRVSKKKPINIAVIGGVIECDNKDALSDQVEVISIIQDAISHIDSPIPLLQKKLSHLSGAQLPNGNLVICGGRKGLLQYSDEYLHCQVGSNQWTKVGTMKSNRVFHSSVMLDGCLITTGGFTKSSAPSLKPLSNLEIFSRHREVLEMKEMPVALTCHTATIFGKNKILVCGGGDVKKGDGKGVSQRTFIFDIKDNSWTNGPLLLERRKNHSSCAIQSDDGSTQSIIIVGGATFQYGGLRYASTTEILHSKAPKWVQGPKLPLGILNASCVALPPTSDIACIVVGGETSRAGRFSGRTFSSNVYGLNRRLTEWTLLGTIRTGRHSHIALPIS